jgi:hypothetical protein
MPKSVVCFGAALFIAMGGCVSLDEGLPTVASNPFSGAQPEPPTQTTVSHAPASDEVSKRVAVIGQKIVALNPEIGMRPRFITIGSPQLEIMHIGTNDLYITEGLANRCVTEGQLAAVLCQELGKMVTQREILAAPTTRLGHREPPPEMPVGRDAGGTFGPPDGTRRIELMQFEKERQRVTDFVAPPDADVLARRFLEKAGFPLTDQTAVAPLLREAEKNGAIYRQLQTGQPTASVGRPN